VDIQSQIAWKDGLFFFENEPIESIMKQIARWYDVEVVYEGDVAGKTVWGSVTRYANVSKVLSILELTGEIHFKVEERRITVRK
jgi:ferric-dicitrate binding protein FerR (iron transport regulator)